MKSWLLLFRLALASAFGLLTAVLLAVALAYLYVASDLPSTEELRDIQFQVPLRVYSRDGLLIAEFGEQRRTPVSYAAIPPIVIQAFLGAEDDRFFQHPGVDYQGLLRAALELVRTGEKRQGGSTITMQVARNFFLSTEKSYLRKVTEIFLAFKIERNFSKEEILALYLNKIFLGQRAYGIAAAAEVYYGATLGQLTLPQVAMIAGLPKAPSRDNPISNPRQAEIRRNYVLARMYQLGSIDAAQYQEAVQTPDNARLHAKAAELEAPYAAEIVRAEMVQRYGTEVYTSGYQVFTTLESERQQAATQALRSSLMDYDQRHGYRGPEARVELAADSDEFHWRALLGDHPPVGGLPAGLVIQVEDDLARIYSSDFGLLEVPWEGMRWARRFVSANQRGAAPARPADVLQAGDIIRLQAAAPGEWRLAQVPEVEGALVSLRPEDGALVALVGGFDFSRSKFNRAIQAERQPGSSFKPFIYSAGLERGFTTASIINDAPVVFDDPSLETTWRPVNYSGRFYGPTRLREALVHSRNLVSVRLLQDIGAGFAIAHAQRFGFDPARLPRNLSLALGSGTATPLEMARGFAVFANGGFLVEPYLIERVLDAQGELLEAARPLVACPECEDVVETAPAREVRERVLFDAAESLQPGDPEADLAEASTTLPAPRVLSPQNAYLMTSMMQDVIQQGTGRQARSLGRSDLAGKTGTTNDQRDAWFCGYNAVLATTTWVGFDQLQPLGSGETGGRAALPMWIAYMEKALQGVPAAHQPPPDGLVTVRIDPATGLLPGPGQTNTLFETFRAGEVPRQAAEQTSEPGAADGGAPGAEPLF
jgi:penicillin-binding protein 1A